MQLPEPPEARARRYRNMAAILRRQADAPDRKHERADMLSIAAQYDRIADRLLRSVLAASDQVAGAGLG